MTKEEHMKRVYFIWVLSFVLSFWFISTVAISAIHSLVQTYELSRRTDW